MSRKHTNRKHRPANTSAWLNVIDNSKPTGPEDVLHIMNKIRLSYERLKAGHGTTDDFNVCGATVNVGLIRAEAIGQPLVEAFKAAGEAMLECDRISIRHGKTGFTGPHLLAMNAAMDLYAEILTLSSPNQMHLAAIESSARIRAGEFISA